LVKRLGVGVTALVAIQLSQMAAEFEKGKA
jgi:hypothetical protein